MTRGRGIAVALAVLAAAGLLVAIGRWERQQRADEQVRGMRGVLTAVGPLDSPSLSSYRYLAQFQCLIYRRGQDPFALELCVEPSGRLVEAIDRRSGDPKFWSLRDDPERSTILLDRDEVDRLLRRMGVPERFIRAARREAAG